MSDEQWEEEYLYPLADKKVDNSNHSAIQFRLYSTINKARKLFLILIVIAVGSLLLINPDIVLQTVGAIIGVYLIYEITLNDDTWSVWDILEDEDKK